MDIREYIAAEMLKPFLAGQTDCANTADRWFAIRRGFSPLERFGRQVRDAADMSKWLAESGGLLRGLARVARANGVAETTKPEAGDIGIVMVGRRACVALYNGETWWSRDEDGYIVTDDTYRYKAWSVG